MSLQPLALTPPQRRALRQLQKLHSWAQQTLAAHPINDDDLRHVVLFQFAGASHRLIRALIAEVKGGSSDNISSIMRALIEILINTKYILSTNDDTRARAFIFDDVRTRVRLCNKMIGVMSSGKADSMSSISTLESWQSDKDRLSQELAELESRWGRANIAWPKLEVRAKAAGLDELYAGPYWLFSQDEHLTARGLNRFMRERGESLYFSLEHDLHLLQSILEMAYVYFMALLNECSERTEFPAASELERFNSVVEQINGQAKIRP